jgi:hypothetical protein
MEKRDSRSLLDEIPGVGTAKKKALCATSATSTPFAAPIGTAGSRSGGHVRCEEILRRLNPVILPENGGQNYGCRLHLLIAIGLGVDALSVAAALGTAHTSHNSLEIPLHAPIE